MIDTGFWYLFPISILIASIAMMAGIGGAVLFSPLFMLVFGMDPVQALAAGLVIEVFGFSSGVFGYMREDSIDFRIVRKLIIVTLPGTILGVIIGRYIPGWMLKLMLACLLIYLSYQFLVKDKECLPKHPRFTRKKGRAPADMIGSSIKASNAVGGAILGMISSGLGEINEYNFLKKLKLPLHLASGTSVYLVATSAIVGVVIHGFFILREGFSPHILSLLLFAVPGVVTGAQVGVWLSSKIRTDMGKYVGTLFLLLGIITLLGS